MRGIKEKSAHEIYLHKTKMLRMKPWVWIFNNSDPLSGQRNMISRLLHHKKYAIIIYSCWNFSSSTNVMEFSAVKYVFHFNEILNLKKVFFFLCYKKWITLLPPYGEHNKNTFDTTETFSVKNTAISEGL